jgi:tetratricopeptide (TPR) repeat protein
MFNNNLSVAAIETETIRLKQYKERKSHQDFLRFYEAGVTSLNRGDYPDAITNFEEALKIDNTNRSAQRYLIEAITANMERRTRKKPNGNGKKERKKVEPKPESRYLDRAIDQPVKYRPIRVKRAIKIPIPQT